MKEEDVKGETEGPVTDEQKWQNRMFLGAETLKNFLRAEGWNGQPEYYLQHLSIDFGEIREEVLTAGSYAVDRHHPREDEGPANGCSKRSKQSSLSSSRY